MSVSDQYWEKPYTCKKCGESFTTMAEMSKHSWEVHITKEMAIILEKKYDFHIAKARGIFLAVRDCGPYLIH